MTSPQQTSSPAHMPKIFPHALLRPQDGSQTEGIDSLALVLPVNSAPPVVDLKGDVIQVELLGGVARWSVGDGRVHQVGSPTAALETEAQGAITSEAGLLVAFMDSATGQAARWSVFKSA